MVSSRSADSRPKGTPARRTPGHTGQAFVDAATNLFAEKGFHGTSIGDLAQELGLTTASLYYHVSGKQELLFRVLDRGTAEFLPRLEEVVQRDLEPRQKLRLAVENHLDFVLGNQKVVAVFLRERRFLKPPYREAVDLQVDRYDRLFTMLLEEGMSAGTVPQGDAALLRLAILGMISWIVEWYRPRGRLSPAQLTQQLTDLVMERILTMPEQR